MLLSYILTADHKNYTNYYFENQKVDFDNFTKLTPFASNMDNNSINALLQVYNTQIQDNINQTNSYGLNIQANDLIAALKNSYVNLVDLAKNLSISNSNQYISYSLPYTMSIREVCFNNNLDFDNINVIKSIIAANQGNFASVNKIS